MKLIGYIFGITSAALLGIFGIGAVYLWEVANDLPDHRKLAEWEPALMTRFYAYDGTPIAEYARERRLYLPIAAIPERVKAAFLSAEDKSFYSHSGIDVLSVVKAAWSNAVNLGSGQRLIGASTITQQLAKNFLLSSDRTLRRKIKEAVLSIRIERSLSKDRILELYLNDIYLGLGAYGIAAGALTYFEKSASELTVAEAAYLAALPKGPNNYNPHRHPERAVSRRNWVIGQMQRNGFVSAAQASNMMARPLGVKPQAKNPVMAEANYFVEEVRREVAGQYGEAALYDGGLSVRTTLDPTLQAAALMALRAGLVDYDQARGFRGPVAHIDISGDWATALAKHETFTDMKEWQLAVVLSCSDAGVGIGLRRAKLGPEHSPTSPETGLIGRNTMRWALKLAAGGKIRQVDSIDKVLSPGDVIYVEKVGNGYLLRQIPEVQGAIVSMDPNTGRVLASVGGFSFAQSRFNRATQASRQPGSAFKPFVYAAALDTGYTPATLVMDAPFSMPDGAGRLWKPKNYDGKFGGPSTLRTGLEMSRNLMTVRLARHLGMDLVAEYGRAFGLYDKLAPYLPMSLGRSRRNDADAARFGLCGPRQWRTRRAALDDRPHPGSSRAYDLPSRRSRLRSMQRHKVAASGSAGASRYPQAGARPNDGLSGDIDAARRGRAWNGAPSVAARRPRRRQDRDHQRREGCLVRRLHPDARDRHLHGLRRTEADGLWRNGRRTCGPDLH